MKIAKSVQALEPYTPGEQPKDRGVIKLNATFLILAYRLGSRKLHIKHSVSSVSSHSGQDDTDCIGSGGLRNRLKQYIYRRAMATDFGAFLTFYPVTRSESDQTHMLGTVGNKYLASFYYVTVMRLYNLDTALFVKPVGVHRRKSRRHMLNNHNTGNILPEAHNYVKYCLCASR